MAERESSSYLASAVSHHLLSSYNRARWRPVIENVIHSVSCSTERKNKRDYQYFPHTRPLDGSHFHTMIPLGRIRGDMEPRMMRAALFWAFSVQHDRVNPPQKYGDSTTGIMVSMETRLCSNQYQKYAHFRWSVSHFQLRTTELFQMQRPSGLHLVIQAAHLD